MFVVSGLLFALPLCYLVYCCVTPLPYAHTFTGEVLDNATGLPIPGIVVKVKWTLADYPMLDGGSNYQVVVSAITDAAGKFVMPAPRHRRGLLMNRYEGITTLDLNSPYVTFDSRFHGDHIVIGLKKR
jgi:hypothetical protein